MADWRIVTPTRAPMEDEMEGGVIFQVPASDSTVSARISYLAGTLVVQLFFVDPQVNVRYSFSNNEWIGTGLKPIDITTVDLTIPEEVVAAATIKTSYFNLIAYEKGTTACKLAVTNEAKTLIRNALINKGVDVPDTTPFRQYAGKVGEIATLTPLTLQVSWDPYNTQAARVEYLGSDGAYHISYLAQPEYPNPPDRFEAQIAAGSIIYVNLGGSPASPNPSSSMTLLMSDVGNTEYVYRVGGPSVTSAYLELFE